MHIHWWRYDGYDAFNGGIYWCRWKTCRAMKYGPRR